METIQYGHQCICNNCKGIYYMIACMLSPKTKTKDHTSLYMHVSLSSPHLATRFCSKKLEHHINHVL